MTLQKITQVWIIIFGSIAIYLVGRTDDLQKWGYIFGIIAQPAWFITTYTNKQWGIFALSIFYTFSWINGIMNHW